MAKKCGEKIDEMRSIFARKPLVLNRSLRIGTSKINSPIVRNYTETFYVDKGEKIIEGIILCPLVAENAAEKTNEPIMEEGTEQAVANGQVNVVDSGTAKEL